VKKEPLRHTNKVKRVQRAAIRRDLGTIKALLDSEDGRARA